MWQDQKKYKNIQMDEALKSIQLALNETKKYIELSETNRKKEYKLSALWDDASTKVRHASGELAEVLKDKSKYWQDDLNWTEEEILDKKIDFDSIDKIIKKLLKA